MTTEEKRLAIVEKARSLVGIPFVHLGRTRDGLDCAGLVLLSLSETVGVDMSCDTEYPQMFETGFVFRNVNRIAKRVQQRDALPGDIVVMNFSGRSTHLGILAGATVIHADSKVGRVVEETTDKSEIIAVHKHRVVAVYTAFGVN
jgi:cell wall-associated NlpC family hydrolase